MSDITLYINNSDKRVIGKNLTDGLVISGDIKASYDNMTISIPLDKNSINTDILKFNYMKFEGSYYFLSKPVYMSNGIVQFNFEKDLLETWKLVIANQTVLLERSETYFNRYLPDEHLNIKSYKRVQTKKFPNGLQLFGDPILVCTKR